MEKNSKCSKKLHSSSFISETVRWKVVKMAHNLKDDMEVAKILLDCYDAVISGCLQWANNSRKNRLPYCTSDKGWTLLEEIMYMMEWKDRQGKKQLLTVWIDDDGDDDDDDEDNNIDNDTDNEKEQMEEKGEVNVKVETMVDQSGEQDSHIKEANAGAILDVDDKINDKSDGDEGSVQLYIDKNYHDKSKIKQPVQKRAISMVQRLKNEKTRYSPRGYKKPGRPTKAIEILNTPTQTKEIECKRCEDRFTSVELFLKHFQGHTEAAIIGKKMKKVSDLKLEDVPCIAKILIPCNECNELTDNLELHNVNKHFRRNCELCGDLFKSFGGWSRHMKTHRAKETGVKPHVCNICGRGFSLIGSLTLHRKLHSSERSFICEVCGKGFKVKARLQRHMPIHTAKSLSCEFCGKTFNYKFNLKTHLRTHTGERPFKCTTCGKAYSHNSSLKAHAKSEHGIELEYGRHQLVEFEHLSN